MENGESTEFNGSDPGLRIPHAHRRSLSGGILSRFPFLRSTSEEQLLASPLSGQSNVPQHEITMRENAMASAMRQTKTRKRKGSLRKTALLGTGKLRLERRPSPNMDLHNHEDLEKSPPSQHVGEYPRPRIEPETPEDADRRRLSYGGSGYETSSSISSFALPSAALTIDTTSDGEQLRQELSPPSTLPSPITSPVSHYASTTDDDDGLTFSAPKVTSAADLTRRRSARSAHVQTNSLAHAVATENRDHDYSDTEWWGWIILIATWIVFVVGMGSCLGVWSWAWDVGETPYAPPELEDDPTLPIVGYYPALIILTAVMAWVWVVVAWVGMKYFRHARFVDGEE